MTAKKKVLKRWPEAYSAWSSLYGEWRIYNRIGGRIVGLSYNHAAANAWADAASKLKRSK